MAKHLLASILLTVIVSSASAASSSDSEEYCKTKDSCYYENDMDLCVDDRYVPIYDDVDLCVVDEPKHEESMYDGATGCKSQELDLCDDMCADFSALDLCDAETDDMKPDAETETTKPDAKKPQPVIVKPKLGNVIYGGLKMTIAGPRDAAEDAVTSVLASALQVPESAVIKAQLKRVAGRRLQEQSSNSASYRLQYEVAVPPGQTAEQVLDKAKKLPQTIPQKFAEYDVTVTDVIAYPPPATLTKNHGLFLATTTTLVPITEKMTWLQIVSRAILLIIPCFAGYLGSIPGFEQKFCCK
jgi:hypothetical protein